MKSMRLLAFIVLGFFFAPWNVQAQTFTLTSPPMPAVGNPQVMQYRLQR